MHKFNHDEMIKQEVLDLKWKLNSDIFPELLFERNFGKYEDAIKVYPIFKDESFVEKFSEVIYNEFGLYFEAPEIAGRYDNGKLGFRKKLVVKLYPSDREILKKRPIKSESENPYRRKIISSIKDLLFTRTKAFMTFSDEFTQNIFEYAEIITEKEWEGLQKKLIDYYVKELNESNRKEIIMICPLKYFDNYIKAYSRNLGFELVRIDFDMYEKMFNKKFPEKIGYPMMLKKIF